MQHDSPSASFTYFFVQSFDDAVQWRHGAKAKCSRTLMVSIRAIHFHFDPFTAVCEWVDAPRVMRWHQDEIATLIITCFFCRHRSHRGRRHFYLFTQTWARSVCKCDLRWHLTCFRIIFEPRKKKLYKIKWNRATAIGVRGRANYCN